MTVSSPVVPAPPPLPSGPPTPAATRLPGLLDGAIRVAGGMVAVAAAAVTALLELLFAPVRAGGVLIGVSVPLAVLANVALSWFAHRAVDRKWAVALPAVTWFAVMVVAAGGTDEGDYLLAGNNWVGLAMIVTGSMTFAVMAFRMIIAQPARSAQAPRTAEALPTSGASGIDRGPRAARASRTGRTDQ